MTFPKRFFSNLAAGVLLASSASAQSEGDFVKAFAGDWYVFDKAFQLNGQTCSLGLSDKQEAEALKVTTTGCEAPLNTAETWKISDGRIVFSDKKQTIAVMGGNQFRVTGELADSDNTVVMERSDGDGNSARFAAALGRHKCYFVGFTQECADSDALRVPKVPGDVGYITIETLANLHARAQPRRDAATLGKVAAGTEVKVDQCLTASDGNWCRAKVGDSAIWLAMTALRMEEWPIVTYRVVELP